MSYTQDGDKYEFQAASFDPPIIQSIRVDYQLTQSAAPEVIITENDFVYSENLAVSATQALTPFQATRDTQSTLYLGFTLPPGRLAFPNRPINLYIKVPEFSNNRLSREALRLAWDYFNGETWQTLAIRDETAGFSRSGLAKTVTGAHHVMAITDKPIVLGNTPESQYQHLYEPVSFLGQVSVKVRGAVQLGDFIIPSGLNDGTGIAVSPEKITPIQYTQIVGRAWEASDCEEMKRINTVVGLSSSNPQLSELLTIMQAQQAEIATLKAELNSVKMLLAQSV